VPAFTKIIDDELALAKTRLGKKASNKKARRKYYDAWIVAKGLKVFTSSP
jgi:hypothetical protein